MQSKQIHKFCSSVAIFSTLIFTLLGSTAMMATTTSTDAVQLIPRTVFFNDPNHTDVQISPDGKYITYLAPHKGVLNVWLAEAKDPKKAKPITQNDKRGIPGYVWAYTNEHIVYIDDNEGDENWRIYRVDVKTGEKLDLASFKKVQAKLMGRSQKYPEEILIGLNQRRPDFYDIYRLNIVSGKLDLIFENNQYASFVNDTDLNLKVAIEPTEDGGAKYYSLNKDSKNTYHKKELFKITQLDMFTTSPIFMNKNGDTLYMVDSRGRDTAALVALNLTNQKITLIAEDKRADIDDLLIHPTERTVQAYSSTYTKTEWTILDKSIEQDMNFLKTLAAGEIQVVSRTLDDKSWIVSFMRDNGAPHYYSYDRSSQQAEFLFSGLPELDKMPLTVMDTVIIQSRDNLPLVSYLSLPKESRTSEAKVKSPVPLVLFVHGGPYARDEWGYNRDHQWLSNRGYAVLSVNYRGSRGFGKQFAHAGNGEWGAKIQDDLIDAVNWAVKQGITTKDKVAIMGGSFGGYATLVGMTKTPDFFACGVDIVGMSNLETMMLSIPEYWKPLNALYKIMTGGDPKTEEGRKFLASRSPITFVDNIKKPLLIAQGANDPRVKQAESDQIVKAMQVRQIPVTYVLYPDEGHGFARSENRLSFYAVAEAFLAQYLGGKFEPIQNELKNSTIEIKEGQQHLMGVQTTH